MNKGSAVKMIRFFCILAAFTLFGPPIAAGQTKIVIDDFEQPEKLQWHDNSKLAEGEESLAIASDAERRSNVLRARLVYESQPIFITKTLEKPIPLFQCKSISFWFKLTAKDLSAERALVCRLRTSPTSFTDYVIASNSMIEPGKWVRAEIDVQHPKKVVNIYKTYFSRVNWITFRLDGEVGKRIEFEFFVDDVELELREPPALDYQPQVVAKELAPARRDALIIRNSAASYYNFDQIVESLPLPTSHRVLKFRGLHFPIFDFPASREELMRYSLIIFVDVDPYVLPIEHVKWISDFVASGGGLLFCGGPNTFGYAKDFKKPLADLLPVAMIRENDLVDVNREPTFAERHEITSGIPSRLGRIAKAHLLGLKDGAQALIEVAAAAPPGWGMYSGGGQHDAEVRMTSDARSGRHAVELVTRDFYRDPKTGKPLWIGVALIQGDSNGYSGQGAYPALGNTRYEFSFYLKGDAPSVEVECIGWKTLEAKSDEREYIQTTLGKIKPDADWRRYEGSFTTEKDTRRFVLAFRVKGSPETLKPGQKIVVDDVVVRESGSDKSLVSNGGGEEGASLPILAVGTFHKGRVAVLNAYPDVSVRLDGDFFTSDFYDDLMRQTLRWLLRAGPEIHIATFSPPPRDIMAGEQAKAEITLDVDDKRNAYVTCFAQDRDADQKAAVLGPGGRTSAAYDIATAEPGVQHIVLKVCDREGKLIAMRTCDMNVHSPIEGEVRFRFGKFATAPERTFAFRIIGKTWTKEGFIPPVKQLSARARIVDFGGEVIKEFPPGPMAAENESFPFAEFLFDVPDLSAGQYHVLAELLDADEVVSRVSKEFHVVNKLDLSTIYPIMSIVGGGGGHQEDEEAIRERVDDLIAHNFNVAAVGAVRAFSEWDDLTHSAAMRNYTEAYAQTKDMGLIYEYQDYTNIGKDRQVKPCVYSKGYRSALVEHVDPYLRVGSAVPRLISIKVRDEPFAGPKMMDYCEDCMRVWREQFAAPMPKFEDIAKGDPLARRRWIAFVRDYVENGYAIGHEIKEKAGARWDLLLTFCSPAFGYAQDVAKNQEDLLWWGETADRIDFDVYPYFYPVSDKIIFLQAHFCMALMRNVAQHLKKPWGFYVELDDRNYPMQINPVEASSECAMTAVAQGADYLNSFINVTFGDGKTARPERWKHLGRTLEQIRVAGPLLNVAARPPAKLALLFPYTHWQLCGGRWAPHYAYQLLQRSFGEADLVHEEIVRREGFQCRALALLETDYLPDDIAKRIVDFVKDGGILLCDRVPKLNENGEPCKLPPDLFTGSKFGKGEAVLLPFQLDERFKSAVEDEDRKAREDLREKIRNMLFGRGLRPRVIPDDPEFEIGYREAKDTIILAAVNHGSKEAETDVTLFNPPFEIGYLTDANGREYAVVKADEGARFRLKLKTRCGLLLFAYPGRPAGLKLDVLTPVVKQGETLRYRVTAVDPSGRPCRGEFVLTPRVADPKGEVRVRYAPPRPTAGGVYEAAIPAAVNAPRGLWQIEIEDRFAGRMINGKFEVK